MSSSGNASVSGPASDSFGILLAAGSSRRWPDGPKLLAEFEGRSLLRRACEALAASRVRDAVVVLGADADRLEPECRDAGVRTVHNPDFARGQSTSLGVGVRAAPPTARGFLLTVADQPLLTQEHLDRVIETGERTGRITCVRTTGIRGAPAWFPASMREQLTSIEGDRGARELIAACDEVAQVGLPDAALLDIDRPEDLAHLVERHGGGP